MIYKPEDFGTGTAAFNAAFAAIRQDGRGVLELRAPLYQVGTVNATNLNNLEIYCEPGTVIDGTFYPTAAPILDLTKSHTVRVEGGDWRGGNLTKAAFLVALGDKFFLERVVTKGYFSAGALCVVAASSVSVRDAQLYNQHATSPVVMISTVGDWGISSDYDQSHYQSPNVCDIYFGCTEIHGLGHQPWTTYMRQADHVVFEGGLHDNSSRAHMLFQGNCARITSIGQKFYAEIGSPSGAMFECDSPNACHNLSVTNASHDFIPNVRIGSGNWSGFEMSPP